MKEQNILTNGITLESLAQLKSAVTSDMVENTFVANKKFDRMSVASKEAFKWILDNNDMDDHIVDSLNSIKRERNIQSATNSLALKLNLRRDLINHILGNKNIPNAIYFLEIAKLSIAASLIDALGYMGIIAVDVATGTFTNPVTGFTETYTANHYFFQEKVKVLFDSETGLCAGVSLTAGELGASKLKLKPWEKDIKFNGEQKAMLRDTASMAVRLIKHDVAWWTKRFKEEEWYKKALIKANKGQGEDRTNLNYRVDELAKGIVKMSEYDRLYFTWSFQISGRFLAMCNLLGIAPHGDGKHAWEMADAVFIDKAMQDKAKAHATKVWLETVRKELKPNTKRAMNIWRANKAKVLDWLSNTGFPMSKQGYFNGIKEILVANIGDKTHKFIGEDLTTNGVGVFSSNYAVEGTGKMTNLSGSDDVQDPHQFMADMLGYDTRDEMKKTGISAGLFHGQGVKGIAKNAGIKLIDLIQGLDNAFGREWRYFNQIASFVGRNMIDNMHTSTRMISPEGWYFINQAYAENTIVKLTYFCLETDSGLRTITIIRDMPILFDSKGFPLNSVHGDGAIKLSGGYANTIHMLDAWMMREVMRNVGCVLHHIHDNFFVPGNRLDDVMRSIKLSHLKMRKHNYLERNINYMNEQAGFPVKGGLTLKPGTLTDKMIMDSSEFMQP